MLEEIYRKPEYEVVSGVHPLSPAPLPSSQRGPEREVEACQTPSHLQGKSSEPARSVEPDDKQQPETPTTPMTKMRMADFRQSVALAVSMLPSGKRRHNSDLPILARKSPKISIFLLQTLATKEKKDTVTTRQQKEDSGLHHHQHPHSFAHYEGCDRPTTLAVIPMLPHRPSQGVTVHDKVHDRVLSRLIARMSAR